MTKFEWVVIIWLSILTIYCLKHTYNWYICKEWVSTLLKVIKTNLPKTEPSD
jgi:hypothetical protein